VASRIEVAFVLALAILPVCGTAIPGEDCGARIQEALAALGQQKPREAEQLALAATRACPKEPAAYSMLGMTYDSENRFGEAQAAYRQAILLDPKVAALHDNLAVSYMRSGKQDEAAREFQIALRLDPENETANLNLGAYYLDQKMYRRAVDFFHAARAEVSNDPEVLLGITQAYLGAGQKNAALQTASRLSAIGGSDPKIHFSLGLLLAEDGEYARAAKEFEAIPAQDRDFAVALNLGMVRSRLGQFSEARQAYQEASQLDPSSPEPYLRIGLDYSAARNSTDAISWISRAYDKAPERTDISYALAEELIRTRNYERAHDLLSSGLRSHPQDSMLQEALGDLYSRQNQVQEAIDAYLRCLDSSPRRVSARLSLAEMYLDAGRAADAKTEFGRILQVEPDNPEATARLGKMALEAGQRDAALQYTEKALARDPDNLTANEDLAQIRMKDGKLDEAEATLEKLVKLDPDNPRFHYLLSRVLARLNRQQEAESEFELSKKLEAGPRN